MAKYSKNDIIRIVDEEDIEFIQLQPASLRRHSTTSVCSTDRQ